MLHAVFRLVSKGLHYDQGQVEILRKVSADCDKVMCVRVRVYTCMCTCVRACVHVYVCVRGCGCAHVCMCMCMCVCAFVCASVVPVLSTRTKIILVLAIFI